MDRLARFRGALLGLAAGDALGTTVEFRQPGTFAPIGDMIGGGPFGLPPGAWTDDTSMALCLAASLIDKKGFDPADQMARYLRWYREGYMSSTGHCFDIGNTVRTALLRYELHPGTPFCGSVEPATAGNGSIMRLAPIPMLYADDLALAAEQSAKSSRTTHGAPDAVDACRYLGALIAGALGGMPKEALLSPDFAPVPGYFTHRPLADRIGQIRSGSFRRRNPPDIRGTGYVGESLEAALWAFDRSTSFDEGALMAVNLGNDADTTGAVFGQLAGAYYGDDAIPLHWRNLLVMKDLIVSLAEQLAGLASDRAEGA